MVSWWPTTCFVLPADLAWHFLENGGFLNTSVSFFLRWFKGTGTKRRRDPLGAAWPNLTGTQHPWPSTATSGQGATQFGQPRQPVWTPWKLLRGKWWDADSILIYSWVLEEATVSTSRGWTGFQVSWMYQFQRAVWLPRFDGGRTRPNEFRWCFRELSFKKSGSESTGRAVQCLERSVRAIFQADKNVFRSAWFQPLLFQIGEIRMFSSTCFGVAACVLLRFYCRCKAIGKPVENCKNHQKSLGDAVCFGFKCSKCSSCLKPWSIFASPTSAWPWQLVDSLWTACGQCVRNGLWKTHQDSSKSWQRQSASCG